MQSLRGPTRVLTGVFIAIMAVSALAAASDMFVLAALDEERSGEPVSVARWDEIDARQIAIGRLQLGLFLVSAVVFLLWFQRAHENLRIAWRGKLRFPPGEAIRGFIVPGLNLVRPYQVMRETWAGSMALCGNEEDVSRDPARPFPFVGLWWALFLISSVLGALSGLGPFQVMLMADLMDIPAAIAAVLLVRRITDLQEGSRAGR